MSAFNETIQYPANNQYPIRHMHKEDMSANYNPKALYLILSDNYTVIELILPDKAGAYSMNYGSGQVYLTVNADGVVAEAILPEGVSEVVLPAGQDSIVEETL